MNKYRILIVDDEEDILEICTDAFADLGHEVETSDCPLKAVDLLSHDQSFDLIISDSKMPGLSGQQFFLKVKEIFHGRYPYFFLSTGDLSLNYKQLKEDGITDVIMKPYDVDDLVAFVVGNQHLNNEVA